MLDNRPAISLNKPRHGGVKTGVRGVPAPSKVMKKPSGRRDSNPRRPPWQGGTLPLSYSRKYAALASFPPRSCQAPSVLGTPCEGPRPRTFTCLYSLRVVPHRRVAHDRPVLGVDRLLVMQQLSPRAPLPDRREQGPYGREPADAPLLEVGRDVLPELRRFSSRGSV